MTAPGLSRAGDIPELKRLWQEAFGDDAALIDAFFSSLYRPDSVFVVRDGETVAAMACHLPMTICHENRGWAASYLYAVATDKRYRGHGLCGQLLGFAAGYLPSTGSKALLLVPGSTSLREFYRRRGFADFTTADLREWTVGPVDGTVEAVEAPVYLELREQLLASQAYVSCPVPVLEFQKTLAELYGGGLYRLSRGDREGCACVAVDGNGRAIVYELLWPGDRAEGAALAASAVGTRKALCRTPGDGQPFAMVHWLTRAPDLPIPYLGIALD